jgi:hypothetical protein
VEGALRYVCSPCRTSYAQQQGLTRHIRKAHNPSLCLLCEFKWGRRYEYRNHLRRKHPGVDPDMILGKAPGPRRRATIRTGHVSQQPPVLPPAIEQDQQNWAGSTATHSPSNPETPPMRYSPFSDADIDAAFNTILTNSTF